MEEIEIKLCDKEFHPFIYATWLHSYRESSYFGRKVPKQIFMLWHHRVIERILERSTTEIYVAASKKDLDLLYGYLVYEFNENTNLIHYMFVKEPFRRFGIAKKLLAHKSINVESVSFTHWTRDCDWMKNSWVRDREGNMVINAPKAPGLTFNPYLI